MLRAYFGGLWSESPTRGNVLMDPLLGAGAAAVLFERNPLADGAQVLREREFKFFLLLGPAAALGDYQRSVRAQQHPRRPAGHQPRVVRRAARYAGVREILRVRKFDDRLGACIEDPGERRRRGLLDLCFLLDRLLVAFVDQHTASSSERHVF